MLVAVVTLLLLTASAAESARCQSGWVEGSAACYQLVTAGRNWTDAEADCQSRGPNGHLATINTQEDNDLLQSLAGNTTWIGLNDIANHRATATDKTGWVWSSGAPYGEYMSWLPGQPNIFTEDCVAMYNGDWFDRNCSGWYLWYICQYDKTPLTVATCNMKSVQECAVRCTSNSLCTSFKFTKEDLMCQLINEGSPKERSDTSFYSTQYKQDNITYWSDGEL